MAPCRNRKSSTTRLASAVTSSGPSASPMRRAASGSETSRWSLASPSWLAGTKFRRQPQIVDVDGLRLQAVGLFAPDVHGAGGNGSRGDLARNAGFLPRFLDQRFGDRRTRGDASADQVVELARVDRLVGAATRKPHRRRRGTADHAVDMRGPRMHAEVARRGPFEQEPWRATELGRHRVEFVSPWRERAFGGQRRRDRGHGIAAGGRVAQRGNERHAVAMRGEDAGEFRNARSTLRIEPADDGRIHAQRNVVSRRRGQRALEPCQDGACGGVVNHPRILVRFAFAPADR